MGLGDRLRALERRLAGAMYVDARQEREAARLSEDEIDECLRAFVDEMVREGAPREVAQAFVDDCKARARGGEQ